MTTTRTYDRPSEADIRHLAAAEAPVILQLLNGEQGRITAGGAASTQAAPVLALNSVPADAGTAIEVELDVAAELAEAAVRPLNSWATNAYRPRRGESAVRLAGSLVGLRERVTARLEFSDTAKRGPERRRLAAMLAGYYGIEFEHVYTWRQVYIEVGCEITETGHWRAISERKEVQEHSYGHGRTDARIWGTPAAVARFVAVLPIVLEEIDRLSLAWGKEVATWLTGAGEYWTTPGERRTTVRHARARFAESFAYALGASTTPPGAGEMDPGMPLPHQCESAALAALREHGWTWLEQWQRPETEAVYEGCASLAERIASRLAEQRSRAAQAAAVEQFEAQAAAEPAAAVERDADRTVRVELTAEDLAALDTLLHSEPAEDLGYRDAPITAPAPRAEAAADSAEDLRAQAAILVELGAPAAAQLLLDQAAELESADAAELLPTVAAEPAAASAGTPAADPAERSAAPVAAPLPPQPIHRTAAVPRLVPAGPWRPSLAPPVERFALAA